MVSFTTNERLEMIIESQLKIMRAGNDSQKVMELAAIHSQELTQADGATVFLVEGDELVCKTTSGSTRFKSGSTIPVEGNQVLGAIQDPQGKSILAAPFYDNTQVVGVLQVFSEKANAFDAISVHTLELMAAYIGNAFSRASDFEKNQTLFRELQVSKLFSDRLVQSSMDGIFAFDCDLRFTFWNPACFELFGVHADQVVGKKMLDVFPDSQENGALEFCTRTLAGEKIKIHNREYHDPKSIVKVYESRWSPLHNDANEIVGGICFAHDVTSRRNAEKALENQRDVLIHGAKMTALGEMAAGIAHEINNPLAIISAKAQVLQDFAKSGDIDPEIFVKNLESIERTIHRIASIISGLQTFSRDGEKDPMRMENLSQIIQNSLALCQEKFKTHGIKLIVKEMPVVAVLCRQVQISQIIINILNNAFDAIRLLPEKWIQIDLELIGDQVQIGIMDSGSGIAPETIPKLMQPFFTTKPIGGGTGLGLSISKGIAEEHQGSLHLDVRSKNTRFIISLPLHLQVKRAA